MEAALAWGVTLDIWNRIHPAYRARMIAHFLYRSQREAFIADHFAPKDDKKDKAGGDDRYDRMMAVMRR